MAVPARVISILLTVSLCTIPWPFDPNFHHAAATPIPPPTSPQIAFFYFQLHTYLWSRARFVPSTVRNKYLRKDEICSKAMSQLSVDDLTFLLNDLGCTREGSKSGMDTDRACGAAADTSANGQNDEQRNATIQMLVGLLKSGVGGGDGENTSNSTSTTSNNRRGNDSSSSAGGGGGGGSRDGSSSNRTLFSSNSINRGSSGNPTTETKDKRTMKKAGYNKGTSDPRTTLGGTTSPPGSPSQRRTKQQPTPVSPSKMPNRHAQPGSPNTSQRS